MDAVVDVKWLKVEVLKGGVVWAVGWWVKKVHELRCVCFC